MNEVLMSIYLKHHLMPYAIHEMRRHPRNVSLLFFFQYDESLVSFFFEEKIKAKGKRKRR
jgi:hypothetical protein